MTLIWVPFLVAMDREYLKEERQQVKQEKENQLMDGKITIEEQ